MLFPEDPMITQQWFVLNYLADLVLVTLQLDHVLLERHCKVLVVHKLLEGLVLLPAGLWSNLIAIWHSQTGCHLDSGSQPGLLTGLVAFRQFKGGGLLLPQLQLRLERPSGLLLLFCAQVIWGSHQLG
jgi:hypothetical protein